jgi:hypothetical protein
MPRVQQNDIMPSSLHSALTDSQCSICGGQLEWKANFDDISQPKYTSQHCNQDYTIRIDTVKVEMMTSRVGGEAARGLEKEKEKEKDNEPRAIKMAEAKKKQQQQEGQSKQ